MMPFSSLRRSIWTRLPAHSMGFLFCYPPTSYYRLPSKPWRGTCAAGRRTQARTVASGVTRDLSHLM